jgi:hypothetical protein
MIQRVRTFIIVLVMLALPVEGVLAAIMPLCAQAQNISAVPETQIPSAIPSVSACAQHDGDKHNQPGSTNSAVDIADFSLSCDGVVCHITGSGLPPAASAIDFTGGFSYTILSNSPFSSHILQQPQRPPLA